MEENEVYYVILNMNFQYEICRNCPKSGIFKGTHEECEAFIDGTRCSNEPNAEFCYIVELVDTVDTTKGSYGDYSVQTNKAILYRGSKSKCVAFNKGIDYELKRRIKMEENSNNLRFENAEPPVSPSSVETNDVTRYIHCDDENLNNEQLSWTPYYSYDDELRNNLKSVIASDMSIDEKVNIIIALCNQTMVQVPTENSNPYNQPKVWYCNSKPEYCTNAKCTDATKPNPYMPYEYCGMQLKLDTENNESMYVPVGGIISAELYNIIKDRVEHGIEYHECDGTRLDKKEYETLYNVIEHKYDDMGDNAEVSDFRLPDAKGLYVKIK